jgi:5-methylcytosine-specific restriction endonuclease McrA
MNRPRSKRPRVKLSPRSYRRLWRQVLERDGWRCQNCGGLTNLQVHHVRSRSQLGDDAEVNLITLCAECHHEVHGRKQAT